MHQEKGPVSQLTADKKQALIACVNQVLADLPNGKKRFVTEAASYDELENRFGKVVMENRAEWKQRIAQAAPTSSSDAQRSDAPRKRSLHAAAARTAWHVARLRHPAFASPARSP